MGTEEIPGKKGKKRRQIGERLRFPKKGTFEITLGPRTITPGAQKVEFPLEQSKEFDELLFARGIHKIAFNSYAFRFGQRNALHNRFNNLRRYVRKADRDELWTYAVKESENSQETFVAIIRSANWGEVVELRILFLDFLVSLMGWKREIEHDLRRDSIYIIRHEGQWQESSLLGLKSQD